MTKKMLLETSSAAPVKSGNRWRAILAVPGQGSSGFYSEDVLREFGPQALAPGAKAFINHDPGRNPRDMIGIYPDGAVYEDGVGLVGELEVFPHFKEFVEAVGPHAAMSIYMLGEADENGNVTKLIPDRQNGCDLVSYGGLEGSSLVEKLYESAHKISVSETEDGTATAAADITQRETKNAMDELKTLVESFIASVDTKFAELNDKIDTIATFSESAAAADAEKVEALEVADALAEAELTESGRKRVIESIATGKAVKDAIDSEKALRDEILKEAKDAPVYGRFGESDNSTKDFSIAGLRFN